MPETFLYFRNVDKPASRACFDARGSSDNLAPGLEHPAAIMAVAVIAADAIAYPATYA